MGSSMDVQESEFFRIASGDLVEVCELFSPTHFYLHRVQDRSKVDRVMGEMRKAYGMSVDRRELLVNPAEVELDMMAAARWGDEGWHRVKVIGFRTNKVEVIYVDFGSRGEVLKNRLYRLCSNFLKESPPYAISLSEVEAKTTRNLLVGGRGDCKVASSGQAGRPSALCGQSFSSEWSRCP